MAPASNAMIPLCMEGTFDNRELRCRMRGADHERLSDARLGAPGHQTADDDVKERSEQQTEERDAEHAREDGDSHDVAHLGAGAAGYHERYDAHDEGERRHQD